NCRISRKVEVSRSADETSRPIIRAARFRRRRDETVFVSGIRLHRPAPVEDADVALLSRIVGNQRPHSGLKFLNSAAASRITSDSVCCDDLPALGGAYGTQSMQ